MKQLLDSVWQRRGISWIWDDEALSAVTQPSEVFSLRQLMRAGRDWPDDLPSNGGNSLVVAGLDASIDLLNPSDAENWLGGELKSAILSFQDAYSGEAALIFWLPKGQRRFHTDMATDAVRWRCAAPHSNENIELGRILWGEAREYPQEIIMSEAGKPVGLFHLRIT
ncbi:hypothetical protein T8K17_22810 [Thalassobaculum sp. OXR-137]|uniref:hypothetical protein n=1 Tax=Thalassobaculum sp. OXR-137 TaxID=3100173 RepID=UPI002AC8E5A6|nr:hypothetical protein [Thalassobaculum sp. OXR-137]WPZ34056.1 hypothetical protein T8K17_22810 [Thalassobaculum sp. OXR-137]